MESAQIETKASAEKYSEKEVLCNRGVQNCSSLLKLQAVQLSKNVLPPCFCWRK